MSVAYPHSDFVKKRAVEANPSKVYYLMELANRGLPAVGIEKRWQAALSDFWKFLQVPHGKAQLDRATAF